MSLKTLLVDTGFFPWNVTLPWADSSGNKSSNNVTFKVVDTSQVSACVGVFVILIVIRDT